MHLHSSAHCEDPCCLKHLWLHCVPNHLQHSLCSSHLQLLRRWVGCTVMVHGPAVGVGLTDQALVVADSDQRMVPALAHWLWGQSWCGEWVAW